MRSLFAVMAKKLKIVVKSMRLQKAPIVPAFIAAILVIGGVTLITVRAGSEHRQALAEQRLAAVKKEVLANQKREEQRKLAEAAAYDSQKTAAASSSPTPAPPVVKYATSSDPRSTAYSTTPPAPSPASFEIKITHNGQLNAGDMVYYNATKGEKGYYNGDLMLNPASVTISRSGLRYTPITISSPSTKTISMPSEPWNDQNPYFLIAFQGTGAPASSLSYNMIVDTYSMPPAGTYQLHITAGCGDGASDGCQSDAFIVVRVVD